MMMFTLLIFSCHISADAMPDAMPADADAISMLCSFRCRCGKDARHVARYAHYYCCMMLAITRMRVTLIRAIAYAA